MVAKNEHQQRSSCPVACALDIVGDHWTLLIIRDLLLLGRHEFSDMLAGPEGISSNILADRLNKLQRFDLIRYVHHHANKRRKLYYLTGKGKDLIHLVIDLVQWTGKHEIGSSELPEVLAGALQLSRAEFVEQVFQQLSQWEAEHDIKAVD